MPNGALQYRYNQVQTASPQELVLMLYDAAIKSGRQAAQAIRERDFETANERLIHMQDIFAELIRGLDLAYPLADHLLKLYDFMTRHVIAANIGKDVGKVEEVLQLLADLRETWAQAIVLARKAAAVDTDAPSAMVERTL